MSLQTLFESLKNYVMTGGKLVDQNTANIRAEICASCHANKADPEAKRGCCGKGLVASAASMAIKKTIVGDRVTTSHNKLGKCDICGCPNNLTVWFPSNPMGDNDNTKNAFPSFCWRKQILEL